MSSHPLAGLVQPPGGPHAEHARTDHDESPAISGADWAIARAPVSGVAAAAPAPARSRSRRRTPFIATALRGFAAETLPDRQADGPRLADML